MKYYVTTSTHTNLFGLALSSHAHSKYLEQLLANHIILTSGLFAKPEHHTEMTIFIVDDRRQLQNYVTADPYVGRELIAGSSINEWQPTIGSLEKPAETPANSKLFVVTYDVNPKIDLNPLKGAHKTYLKKLLKSNQLRVAGPYKGTGTEQQGMYILNAANRNEARKLAAADPYLDVKSGAYFEVNEWQPKYGEF